MPIKIVHLSDLHLRKDWYEEQGAVLEEFLADLKKQVDNPNDTFILFTGDIIQEGADNQSYEYFSSNIGHRLSELGFEKKNYILLPGNHDIDREYTKSNFSILKGLQERKTNETAFNEAIYTEQSDIIGNKFQNFLEWQEQMSGYPLKSENFAGRGFGLTTDIGIYCLNTALYSFGGLKDEAGVEVSDFESLVIETRNLYEWMQNSSYKFKILAMHHPEEWLVDWAKKQLGAFYARYFDVVFYGHIHNATACHHYNGVDNVLVCSSPPLFTRKDGVLGYSLISIQEDTFNVTLTYRQWAKDRFVTGTSLSGTDSGSLDFSYPLMREKQDKTTERIDNEAIGTFIKNKFERCLKCYSSLPAFWVPPIISDQSEFDSSSEPELLIKPDHLIFPLRDCVIKSPPQFGLTSLGRYLAFAAWNANPKRFLLFIESSELQNHESAIEDHVNARLSELGLVNEDMSGIILDEEKSLSTRKVNNLKKVFPNIPLIILLRVQDSLLFSAGENEELSFPHQSFYLWSLDRPRIRQIVRQFVQSGFELPEQAATQRLVDDIDTLNLHRTPLNCFTLLAVYARELDFSPTNRTDMFEKFLTLIFYEYKKTPDYSSMPDMKDALFVLGAFCERFIYERSNNFTKSAFINASMKFCAEMSVDIDVAQLFDIMLRENNIVPIGSVYCFCYVHWIYFFSAHRMHRSKVFGEYVLTDQCYMDFPEIIEFYSGIDRQRQELLEVLLEDLSKVNREFEERTGIDGDFDPLERLKWESSDKQIEDMVSKLEEEGEQTKLPDEIKDTVADQGYDRAVPYRQNIRKFGREASFLQVMQILTAAARALRNSDYVPGELKERLLGEILNGWKKELQVGCILAPALAQDGKARFENVVYRLRGDFEAETDEELLFRILVALPLSVMGNHYKDIGSPRMTTLFHEVLRSGLDGFQEFVLGAVLSLGRSPRWEGIVEKHIRDVSKNSFYLLELYHLLRHEHIYGFTTNAERESIFNLLALTLAKHEKGAKSPNKKLVERYKNGLRGKIGEI